ncbi:uncharacterized protein LOC129893851 [Solanum dulcamara]|uniref:uncharacterized protein LOC129893851 n=1 Tax=Solanum dulcamara TaxID=45834 RepID=UPI0024869A55|nr:uncharacterized protein LOC129893851 [Solanum dulcamara]
MAPFEALYGRRYRSLIGLFEVGEVFFIGIELVYEGMEKILRRYGKIAYDFDLPSMLALVHPVFHVSLLKKCIGDLTSIVPLESIGVKDRQSYEEVWVDILDCQVRKLRNKEVSSMKVLWRNQLVEGATWEAEDNMMSHYPHLFPSISA